MKLTDNNLQEIISLFPNHENFAIANQKFKEYDFFFAALGFEERTLAIPKIFSEKQNCAFKESIYFQYETSTIDNAFNEPKLLQYFKKISLKNSKLFCDEPGFMNSLKEKISIRKTDNADDNPIKIMFDISVCSSKLILNVVKFLLALQNIELTIVYTEAKKYYPDYVEYKINKAEFKEKTIAVDEKVVLNSDFPGGSKFNSDLIISFPNFKAQRVKNIISEIDETILLKSDDRLIFIIGDPNMDTIESNHRKEMMLEINDITDTSQIYEVSTIDYKSTIEKLDLIYQKHNLNYHINIADLGSKMQTLGICIYCLIRPEISIYNTIPVKYGPSKYSSGVKDFWTIKFGLTQEIMKKINLVDTIEIL